MGSSFFNLERKRGHCSILDVMNEFTNADVPRGVPSILIPSVFIGYVSEMGRE